MLELIIVTSLLATFILHLLYKWKIKNPLNCDFCLAFWLCIVGINFYNCLVIEMDIVTGVLSSIIPSICSSVVSHYISMRLNMYAGGK